MTANPCVLQVVPNLNSGGVERGTLEVATALVHENYNAYVCSNGGSLVTDLIKIGVGHFSLPVHSKNPIIIFLNIFKLKKIILKYDINIVHARSRAPAWSCYFACKIANVKFITTFHGTYGNSNALKKIYNSIMLKGVRVIAISKFIYEHILNNYNVDKAKLQIINRGVDINYFTPENVSKERIAKVIKLLGLDEQILQGKKIILLPARFTNWKGHLYLLDIISNIKDKNFLCLMVGFIANNRDEYVNQIKVKIQTLSLKERVYLASDVKDIVALYAITNYVVSSSLDPEAFGRVIIEGQAMGKVVIATNHGGAATETIIDHKTGFHIPFNNVIKAAQVFDEVLSLSANEYAYIAKQGMQLVKEKYTTEAMCKETIRVYNSLLIS
jgi:glycosyltransferase involved in cell wall biosynthesis